ncbi:MAG: GFA family protein [Gammaproteobacteria bacterium]|nr:GFA family protein [Gammaproteobacteria bacterium]MCB1851030.1 GFA family protein [Gammaproteobacteria bacterium]MCP5416674.1 GFA family protein [Chromatiaceae bacterium]
MSKEIAGSCLCGKVRFTIWGPFSAFHLCHCSRCRKDTGSAHASNIFTEPGNIRWLSGEEIVQRYDLPTAERFAKCFCRECGSPVPYLSRDHKFLIIPAGSLDADPDVRPQDHIFWQDRADWYEAGLAAVHFDGYPK